MFDINCHLVSRYPWLGRLEGKMKILVETWFEELIGKLFNKQPWQPIDVKSYLCKRCTGENKNSLLKCKEYRKNYECFL